MFSSRISVHLMATLSQPNRTTVVQRVDSTMQWINQFLLDSAIGFNIVLVIHWMVIYNMDSNTQSLIGWGLGNNIWKASTVPAKYAIAVKVFCNIQENCIAWKVMEES